MALEVVSDANLFVFELEGLGNGILVKFDVSDDVGPLVAPIGNNGLSTEFKLDTLLKVVLVLGLVCDLVDSLEACLR